MLKRDDVKVINLTNREIELVRDDILDSGSYCNIVKVESGILRKELKPIYLNDDKINKRLRYEFENMKKLEECPQILSVFDFDSESNSYLMKQGEMNLYAYLTNEKEIAYNFKFKIIMDILKGMSFAHENSIIHRDLHLGNILKLENDFVICDFGLSKDISIERSMKTSYTEKNNHLFVDPIALTDFTKLDIKSDIYSIGKIIDFILPTNDIFKPIVERCICMDREVRYDSVKEIIKDIEIITKSKGKEKSKQKAIEKILNSEYDVQVHEFILNLLKLDELNKFIVKHNLNLFAKIILHFESSYQYKIVNNISIGYAEATGFGGWSNYDIFAEIAYDLCISSENFEIKRIAKNILIECAQVRFEADRLLKKLNY